MKLPGDLVKGVAAAESRVDRLGGGSPRGV